MKNYGTSHTIGYVLFVRNTFLGKTISIKKFYFIWYNKQIKYTLFKFI